VTISATNSVSSDGFLGNIRALSIVGNGNINIAGNPNLDLIVASLLISSGTGGGGTGDVFLPRSITTNGGNVTILAAGSIGGVPATTSINTTGTSGSGNITIIAGVSSTTSGGVTTATGASGLPSSITSLGALTTAGAANKPGGNVYLGSFNGGIEQ